MPLAARPRQRLWDIVSYRTQEHQRQGVRSRQCRQDKNTSQSGANPAPRRRAQPHRCGQVPYRTAGLHRKVDKNQTKAIRIILTGSHKQMIKIVQQGHLDKWTDAKLRWFRDTFGADNVVSSVLHMDEKMPYLHATVVPSYGRA